jgi:hypothetical protein
VTGLTAGQQRALNRIEKTLADGDLGLGPLFSIFTRLAAYEPMPAMERLTAPTRWRWRIRRTRMAAVTVIGLAAVTGTIVLSQTPGRPVCPGTVIAVSAHVRPAGTVQPPSCMSGQAGLRRR